MNSEANFRCPETGKEFFIPQYKTKFPNGEKTYTDTEGDPLINPDNKMELVPIEKEWDGGMPSSGTGTDAAGKEKTRQQLKNRSKKDFQKNHKWNRGRQVHNFDTQGKQGL